ncbi:MAG TPA: T9SS type A sorting domain-containing protein, partial [Bacteroidia bacterium]|nr:T9SS type A sorting domain-containing protein [Bacteroidia bacterium]
TWQALYVPPAELNPANASTPKGKYYQTTGIEMTTGWDLLWCDSLHMLSGYTDISAARSNDGGNTWGFDCSGIDNVYNTTYKWLKNPATGVIYAGTSSVHDMYQSTYLTDAKIDGGTGAIMFSTDTGKTFSVAHNFGHPVIWLALDPTNATRMYAAVINHSGAGSQGGIWVSNNFNLNAGATWTHCNNPPRTQGHPLDIHVLNDGTLVTTFSGRRNATNFTDSSGVFISANQGTSWTDVSDPGMKYWTMDLTVDPNDATQNTWYVCVYSGWGGGANNQGGLYRTTNRGTSWTKIVNSTMNNVGDTSSCFSVSFDPINKGAAYMTTETGGLYYTTNISAAVPVFNQVTSYPFHQPTRVFFNPYIKTDVWVNSQGNGLEMGSTLLTGMNSISNSNSASVSVYPNPNKGGFRIMNNESEITNLEVYNVLGEMVYSRVLNSGVNQLNMANEENGVYLYRVLSKTGELLGTGKVVIEK